MSANHATIGLTHVPLDRYVCLASRVMLPYRWAPPNPMGVSYTLDKGPQAQAPSSPWPVRGN